MADPRTEPEHDAQRRGTRKANLLATAETLARLTALSVDDVSEFAEVS